MAVLAMQPELSAAQVAERTAMDKVAVSRAVSSLLDKGRIERSISPGDRRLSILKLSAEGTRIYREVVPLALRHEQSLIDVLDSTDRQALERILDILLGRARSLGDHI